MLSSSQISTLKSLGLFAADYHADLATDGQAPSFESLEWTSKAIFGNTFRHIADDDDRFDAILDAFEAKFADDYEVVCICLGCA